MYTHIAEKPPPSPLGREAATLDRKFAARKSVGRMTLM